MDYIFKKQKFFRNHKLRSFLSFEYHMNNMEKYFEDVIYG